MRSHNSPWPWQGKFPANEEYAKDIVTMTMKIGEEMVAGSLGALSKAITVPKSGKLIQTNPIPPILNTPLKPWFSREIPHNWDILGLFRGDGIIDEPNWQFTWLHRSCRRETWSVTSLLTLSPYDRRMVRTSDFVKTSWRQLLQSIPGVLLHYVGVCCK